MIVFAHANGFPASTYRQLFEAWEKAGQPVRALAKFGHDERHPVSANWPHLRDELLGFIERESGGRPVHLVGHSMGGYLCLLAAAKKPLLAASIVLVDSPVVAGWRAHSLHVAKLTRLVGRVSPGRVSQRRRHHWDSVEAAHAHFAAKAAFARWAPGVLADYLAGGLEPAPGGGVQLAFKREVETRIYNTLPHHIAPLLQRHPPRCPVGFIGGTQSVEVRQVGLAATRAVTRGRIEWIEGTHLFPMERPVQTARAVLKLITPEAPSALPLKGATSAAGPSPSAPSA